MARFGDALVVLREAGRKAAPLPLAETLLAGQLLSSLEQRLPRALCVSYKVHVSLNESGQLQGVGARREICPALPNTLSCGAARRGPSDLLRFQRQRLLSRTGKDLAGEPSDDLDIVCPRFNRRPALPLMRRSSMPCWFGARQCGLS